MGNLIRILNFARHSSVLSFENLVSHQIEKKSGWVHLMARRDEYGRYEWDDAEFEARFQERKRQEAAHSEARVEQPVEGLRPLVARQDFVKLSQNINKRQVIGDNVPMSKIGNYSCPVCQLYFKDSSVYLKHLNSPEHNEKMGMSMDVMPATDEDVLRRVEQWEAFYTTGQPVPPLYT